MSDKKKSSEKSRKGTARKVAIIGSVIALVCYSAYEISKKRSGHGSEEDD